MKDSAFANAFEADVRRHPDVFDARADMLLEGGVVRVRLTAADDVDVGRVVSDAVQPAVARLTAVADLADQPQTGDRRTPPPSRRSLPAVGLHRPAALRRATRQLLADPEHLSARCHRSVVIVAGAARTPAVHRQAVDVCCSPSGHPSHQPGGAPGAVGPRPVGDRGSWMSCSTRASAGPGAARIPPAGVGSRPATGRREVNNLPTRREPTQRPLLRGRLAERRSVAGGALVRTGTSFFAVRRSTSPRGLRSHCNPTVPTPGGEPTPIHNPAMQQGNAGSAVPRASAHRTRRGTLVPSRQSRFTDPPRRLGRGPAPRARQRGRPRHQARRGGRRHRRRTTPIQCGHGCRVTPRPWHPRQLTFVMVVVIQRRSSVRTGSTSSLR